MTETSKNSIDANHNAGPTHYNLSFPVTASAVRLCVICTIGLMAMPCCCSSSSPLDRSSCKEANKIFHLLQKCTVSTVVVLKSPSLSSQSSFLLKTQLSINQKINQQHRSRTSTLFFCFLKEDRISTLFPMTCETCRDQWPPLKTNRITERHGYQAGGEDVRSRPPPAGCCPATTQRLLRPL